jgi:hypothetical protein
MHAETETCYHAIGHADRQNKLSLNPPPFLSSTRFILNSFHLPQSSSLHIPYTAPAPVPPDGLQAAVRVTVAPGVINEQQRGAFVSDRLRAGKAELSPMGAVAQQLGAGCPRFLIPRTAPRATQPSQERHRRHRRPEYRPEGRGFRHRFC